MDYIQRDSFNCGVKHSVDFQRFIAFMMAVDNGARAAHCRTAPPPAGCSSR